MRDVCRLLMMWPIIEFTVHSNASATSEGKNGVLDIGFDQPEGIHSSS